MDDRCAALLSYIVGSDVLDRAMRVFAEVQGSGYGYAIMIQVLLMGFV